MNASSAGLSTSERNIPANSITNSSTNMIAKVVTSSQPTRRSVLLVTLRATPSSPLAALMGSLTMSINVGLSPSRKTATVTSDSTIGK